jgi:hypothetical protein
MDFLAPAWLGLAAAAAVPLLLHLLRRRIGTRVEFPAARLLARAEQEASARLRLRNWLLMALRVLALLLVAAAAARPFADVPAAGRPPAAVALVLDNSLSAGAVVGGRPVLDALRDAAVAALAGAGAQDRVWLLTVDGAVVGGSRDAVRAALDRMALWPGRGDLPAAVTRAALLAAGAGTGAASVVVLTDGQATAWPRAPEPSRVPVVVVRASGAFPPNQGVAGAAAAPARWTPSGEIVARLASAPAPARGDTAGADVPVTVTLRDTAGREVARVRATGTAGGVLRLAVRPDARGWLAGTVEVPPDEWRGDDRAPLAAFVGEPPAVRADASAGPVRRHRPSPPSRRAGACAPRAARAASPSPSRRRGRAPRRPRRPGRRRRARPGQPRSGAPRRAVAARRPRRRARARPARPLAPGDSDAVVEVARAGASCRRARPAPTPWRASAPSRGRWPARATCSSPRRSTRRGPRSRACRLRAVAGRPRRRRVQPAGEVRTAVPGARVVPPAGATALRAPDGRVTPAVEGRAVAVPPALAFTLAARRRPSGRPGGGSGCRESDVARLSEGALRARVRGAGRAR